MGIISPKEESLLVLRLFRLFSLITEDGNNNGVRLASPGFESTWIITATSSQIRYITTHGSIIVLTESTRSPIEKYQRHHPTTKELSS